MQIEIKEKNETHYDSCEIGTFLHKPEIEVYQFYREIFEAGFNPFLLNATLQYHLEKYRDEGSEFVERMKSSLYIDDLVSGSNTVEEAFSMLIKAKGRLREAGFHMHKWRKNSKELREAFRKEGVTFEMPIFVERIYAKESLGSEESEDKVLGAK